jgi:hypothetical protein
MVDLNVKLNFKNFRRKQEKNYVTLGLVKSLCV